jgi:hypothetical protein
LKSKVLPRQEIFNRIFLGKPILEEELFSQIQAFSPSGKPKLLNRNQENLKKLERHLESKKQRYNRGGLALHLERLSEQESYKGSSVSQDSTPANLITEESLQMKVIS